MGECRSKFCLAPSVSVVLLMVPRRSESMVLPGTCAPVVWTTRGTSWPGSLDLNGEQHTFQLSVNNI